MFGFTHLCKLAILHSLNLFKPPQPDLICHQVARVLITFAAAFRRVPKNKQREEAFQSRQQVDHVLMFDISLEIKEEDNKVSISSLNDPHSNLYCIDILYIYIIGGLLLAPDYIRQRATTVIPMRFLFHDIV